ncbi:unnamed protein product [Caenorhabditis nigoni]
MFKVFIALSILAVAVFSAPFRKLNYKFIFLIEIFQRLTSNPIFCLLEFPSLVLLESRKSPETFTLPTSQLNKWIMDQTMATLFKQFMEKVGEYMKTQSSEDQAALKKLFEEKKADFEAKMAAAN